MYKTIGLISRFPRQPNDSSCNNTESFQSILKVRLLTGRKHQIRTQFSQLGYPIVGDQKYNAPQKFREK